jgi:hypothetical protein
MHDRTHELHNRGREAEEISPLPLVFSAPEGC